MPMGDKSDAMCGVMMMITMTMTMAIMMMIGISSISIRVDKCCTFEVKKASTSSVQHLLKLVLNHDLISTVEIGKSFKYLGRYFTFSMVNHNHLSEVLDLLTILMAQIDGITCHPKNKLLIYHCLAFSKLSWLFTIATILAKTS